MMDKYTLTTKRLELVAGTPEMFRARVDERETLGRELGARVPETWPPPLFDQGAMDWMANYLAEHLAAHPDAGEWGFYFVILRAGGSDEASDEARRKDERTLIGGGGYKGVPTADGTVEIGYSMLTEYQRAGYATEMAGALVGRAFAQPQVTRVIAETYPELAPSIRVLEKNGFRFTGDGSEERVIRFALTRAEYEATARRS